VEQGPPARRNHGLQSPFFRVLVLCAGLAAEGPQFAIQFNHDGMLAANSDSCQVCFMGCHLPRNTGDLARLWAGGGRGLLVL
jgi:hypothetical protein